MTQARILIVEDERVVARDIQNRLTRFGYDVVGVGRSGDDAVHMADRLHPDLILMDIRLQGAKDGVIAAQEIRAGLQLPVVYLTAYADPSTLERARVTEPFGYVLKPFDERELHTAIEMALYKHRAERRLQQSEERYRSIFDNAIEGIFQITPAGRLSTANPALARMLGHESPEELLASSRDAPSPLRMSPERQVEYDRLMKERGLVQGFECQLLRKDGSRVWVSLSARAVRDDRGRVLFHEGAVEEITERKRLEQQSRQTQKLEAIGRLAGGVAHDFNNLLTVIQGCAAMLFRELRLEGSPRALLTEIQEAAERAASVTRQLLVFSRKQPLQPRVIDLDELILGLAQMLRWLLGEDIELVLRLDPDVGTVKVDPGQLEQALMNLATNARDAMPEGGRLTIETRNVELDAWCARTHPHVRPGRHARLVVADTGHGMDEATRARAFEPFFTTKPVGQGTGLGLSLVHGVVRQSGGHIEVESEVGAGTTFTICLPVVEEASAQRAEAAEPSETPAGTETVLLAEDDDGIRRLSAAALRSHGYTVLEAQNGEEALAAARGHAGPIDLLLTDVMMPRMGGRKLAEHLRAERPGLTVLYVSGHAADDVLQRSDDCLPKPFTPSILARKVREVLDARPFTDREGVPD